MGKWPESNPKWSVFLCLVPMHVKISMKERDKCDELCLALLSHLALFWVTTCCVETDKASSQMHARSLFEQSYWVSFPLYWIVLRSTCRSSPATVITTCTKRTCSSRLCTPDLSACSRGSGMTASRCEWSCWAVRIKSPPPCSLL